MAVSRYVTLRAIKHSGFDFSAGTPIALSDEFAVPLLAIEAIQAQAGALPEMPSVAGSVIRESLDTGSGAKAKTYVEASPPGQVLENIGATVTSPIRTIPFAKRHGYIGASITNGSSSSNAGTKSYSALLKVKLNAARKAVSSIYRGYPSQTSTYIAAQVETSLNDNLSALVVGPDFGTNSAGQGVSLAQYKLDVLGVTLAAQRRGVPIVFCKTLPKAASGGAASRDLVGQYNSWLTFFCLLNGIPIVDTYTPMADPLTGYLRAEYDVDGTHPNDLGHAALADAIYPVIASVLPNLPEFVSYGSGGLVAAGYEVMQTLWSDSGVGTAAFTTRMLADPTGGAPLAIGRWSTASIAAAGYRILSKGIGNLGAAFNVGDKLLVTASLSTTSTGGSGASLMLLRSGSTNVAICGSTNIETPLEIASTYVVQPPDTSLAIGLSINCAAGETTTARVGKCGVYNLTTLGLDAYF